MSTEFDWLGSEQVDADWRKKRERKRWRVDLKTIIITALITSCIEAVSGYFLFLAETKTIEMRTSNNVERQSVEIMSEYFGAVDPSMSYDAAVKSLSKELQAKDSEITDLKRENEILQQQVSGLTEQMSSDETNAATVRTAQTYAGEGEYLNALALLKSVSRKTPFMEALIQEYGGKYEALIVAEANKLLGNGQYAEASDVVADALKVLPDSKILSDQKIAVQNATPQALMGVLTPYETYGYDVKTNAEYIEMAGTKYFNGFQLGLWGQSTYAVFNLNGRYSRISGIVGHVDGSSMDDSVAFIFADGTLIKTFEIGCDDMPGEFSVDVTGVRQFKIERQGGNAKTGFAELMIR